MFVMRLSFSGFISLNNSHSSPKGVNCILAWILFFFRLSSASVTQAAGLLLIHAADRSVSAFCFNGVQRLSFIFIFGGMHLY